MEKILNVHELRSRLIGEKVSIESPNEEKRTYTITAIVKGKKPNYYKLYDNDTLIFEWSHEQLSQLVQKSKL